MRWRIWGYKRDILLCTAFVCLLLCYSILFFKEKRQNAMDYIYAILFAGMFLFLTYNHTGIAEIFGTNLPAVITYLVIYAMNILLVTEAITEKVAWLVYTRNEEKVKSI